MSRLHRTRGASGRPWERVRNLIRDRDGWRCTQCGRPGRLAIHHKVALVDGGGNSPANLTTLCQDCHNAVHVREKDCDPERRKWREYLRATVIK